MASFTIINGVGGVEEELLIHVIYDDDAINQLEGTTFHIDQGGGRLNILYTGCISSVTLSSNWGTVLSWDNHVIVVEIEDYYDGFTERQMNFTVEWCDGTTVRGAIIQDVLPCEETASTINYNYYNHGSSSLTTTSDAIYSGNRLPETGNSPFYGDWATSATISCHVKIVGSSGWLPPPAYAPEYQDGNGSAWHRLQEIEFHEPSRVTDVILPYAFALTSITIPSSVSEIKDNAFYQSSGLTKVEFANPKRLTAIGFHAFYHCSSIRQLSLPSGLTSIGHYAFAGCSALESDIVIPSGVTSIGWYAFMNCESVTSLTFADNLELSIEYSTFRNCTSLTNIHFPQEGSLVLNEDAFRNCGIESLTIPSNVILSGTNAFNDSNRNQFADCKNLTSVTFEANTMNITRFCFSGCTSLTNINSLSGKTIFNGAFKGCSSLTEVDLSGAVLDGAYAGEPSNYDEGTFSGCTKLRSIEFGTTVSTIPKVCFANCTSLSALTMSSVEIIGRSAFKDCSALQSITSTDSLVTIGNAAFSGCTSLTSVTLPTTLREIGGKTFSGCTSLRNIVIPSGVTTIGVLYTNPNNDPGAIGDTFADCTGLTSVTIPNTVTRMGQNISDTRIHTGIFSGCTNLTDVIFESGGSNQLMCGNFWNCSSLTSIEFPERLYKLVGASLFSGCTSLTSVTFTSHDAPELSSGAFDNLNSNAVIYVPSDRVDQYKASAVWIGYASRIQPDPNN